MPLVTRPPLLFVVLATPSVTTVPPTVHTAPALTLLREVGGDGETRVPELSGWRAAGGALRMVAYLSFALWLRDGLGPNGSGMPPRCVDDVMLLRL